MSTIFGYIDIISSAADDYCTLIIEIMTPAWCSRHMKLASSPVGGTAINGRKCLIMGDDILSPLKLSSSTRVFFRDFITDGCDMLSTPLHASFDLLCAS